MFAIKKASFVARHTVQVHVFEVSCRLHYCRSRQQVPPKGLYLSTQIQDVKRQKAAIFMATVLRTSNPISFAIFLAGNNSSALNHSSLMTISNNLESLPVPFLSESDMKYDAEAVTLQTILSANGVPTATLPVSTANELDMKPTFCKNRPMYIFVTSGPTVQDFLKRVSQKFVKCKLTHSSVNETVAWVKKRRAGEMSKRKKTPL